MPDSLPKPIETNVQTLSELLQENADFLLLDVREPSEYETARIEGSMLLPMGQLRERFDELEPFRHRHIIVHCHHGGRSMRVTEALRHHGFTQAQNLAGGIDAWSLEIDPKIPRY